MKKIASGIFRNSNKRTQILYNFSILKFFFLFFIGELLWIPARRLRTLWKHVYYNV